MSPEFPYPTPINDCHDVIKYISEHLDEFNVDPKRIIFAGDSAGEFIFLKDVLISRI